MLTAKRVERTKTPGRYRDGEVKGLLLQISKSGAKSWVLRYMLNGHERMMGLGSVEDFTLREARERARAQRQLLADRVDPLVVKREQRRAAKAAEEKAMTFKAAAQRYFDQHQSKWSSAAHREQFLSSMETYAYPVIGDMDVATIGLPDILRVIEPSWTTKTATMDRTRNRIEAVLDWAVVRGHRAHGVNPAKWKGFLDQALPAPRKVQPVEHFAAVDYRDVPAFMVALREPAVDSISARALAFLIFTAARSGEVLGARWKRDGDQFGVDLKTATWTIPAHMMKSKREHKVPLTEPAIELLRGLPREDGNDFVFVGPTPGRGLNKMAFQRVMERLKSPATTHGFRSSFRTWAAETTNFPREVCERALAHAVGSKTEQAYERGDMFIKRRKLMEAWSKYISTPPAASSKKVVSIGGAR